MATTDFPETSPLPFDAAWFKSACTGLDEQGTDLLAKAVQWVREPLAGLTASTGEPLGEHCAEVVLILARSEEHTSELQSLMRISYAVFCLKKKNRASQA